MKGMVRCPPWGWHPCAPWCCHEWVGAQLEGIGPSALWLQPSAPNRPPDSHWSTCPLCTSTACQDAACTGDRASLLGCPPCPALPCPAPPRFTPVQDLRAFCAGASALARACLGVLLLQSRSRLLWESSASWPAACSPALDHRRATCPAVPAPLTPALVGILLAVASLPGPGAALPAACSTARNALRCARCAALYL